MDKVWEMDARMMKGDKDNVVDVDPTPFSIVDGKEETHFDWRDITNEFLLRCKGAWNLGILIN